MGTPLDPTMLDDWIQIRPDNTISVRTGVADFGQGTVGTVFRQLVAEELRVGVEAVEMVIGDTDRTNDGGISAAFMNWSVQDKTIKGVGAHPGSPFGLQALNVQKVAAYAYGELMERVSHVLEVPLDELTADAGTIHSGSRCVTYADLVRDSPLGVRLEIATQEPFGFIVLGNPPVVPATQYRVLGTSSPNPRIPPIVTATATWVGDVRVPGMLHGRMVHPRALGSTLVSVGSLAADRHPNAEVVVRGNLVGVVAPDEWDAIRAAQALAETTVWSDWAGLPGHDGLIEALLETDWSTVAADESSSDHSAADAELAASHRTLTAHFALPYYKHAPISPEVTVADVRPDGTIQIWTSSQHAQGLRVKIARMLGTDPANVTVHFADGAGGFGRTNKGDAGPEAEAVLLSQACGRPVRLQWMREEDFAWSTQQSAYFGEVSVALDESGHMTAIKIEHYHPGHYTDPLLGAVLAGLPSLPPERRPASPATIHCPSDVRPGLGYVNVRHVKWQYDGVPAHLEIAYGAEAIGQSDSPVNIGLRHRSMRSPMQLQQNFAVECMINEAAAAAGADPIQFRLDHTSDPRLSGVLETVRDMSAWEPRPSPADRSNGDIARGRGVAVAIRNGSYNAAVAEITVDLHSGVVTVDRYWLAADVGIVVNPRQLRLNLEGGTVMGISQALLEELQFSTSAITSTDFKTYPILKMAEIPDIEIALITRTDGKVGQGSEPANMLPPVAIAGAFFDATGTPIRKLPMRPEYVLAELRDATASSARRS